MTVLLQQQLLGRSNPNDALLSKDIRVELPTHAALSKSRLATNVNDVRRTINPAIEKTTSQSTANKALPFIKAQPTPNAIEWILDSRVLGLPEDAAAAGRPPSATVQITDNLGVVIY
ncbi:hypothetical protein H257_06960 [Aphanomyces astaci]|uniref:Uncharacterized protein n=1 Tax=Aphanomyces astaci TaxID=112090 RepID=W4GLE1_APHAT|nr:hypothetical protein H257_06960 [Aphanomyces astaci]ETV79723.1 hypothetical protein H257_06960 [Aphanomyces astaci]|eukprot:XP_009830659.1 hypothetical protein H257_06960 [Aphanomyces astaci]